MFIRARNVLGRAVVPYRNSIFQSRTTFPTRQFFAATPDPTPLTLNQKQLHSKMTKMVNAHISFLNWSHDYATILCPYTRTDLEAIFSNFPGFLEYCLACTIDNNKVDNQVANVRFLMSFSPIIDLYDLRQRYSLVYKALQYDTFKELLDLIWLDTDYGWVTLDLLKAAAFEEKIIGGIDRVTYFFERGVSIDLVKDFGGNDIIPWQTKDISEDITQKLLAILKDEDEKALQTLSIRFEMLALMPENAFVAKYHASKELKGLSPNLLASINKMIGFCIEQHNHRIRTMYNLNMAVNVMRIPQETIDALNAFAPKPN